MAKDKVEDEENDEEGDDERYPSRWSEMPLRNALDRFWDDRGTWLEPFDFLRSPRRFLPRVDVSETDDEVRVVADVPGVDPDDLEIDIRGNRMQIAGKTKRESQTAGGERPHRYERVWGEFRRELTLPAKVKENEARAVCRDGVLTVTIPKAEEEKRKRIKIEKG